MATGQIDLLAKMKAFPYVAPPGAGTRATAEQAASDLDDFISNLESIVSGIPSDISSLFSPTTSTVVGTDEWKRSDISDLSSFEKIISALNKPLQTLDKVVSALEKIMRILELFMSGFNSFSKLIVSAINFAQNKLNEFTDTSLSTGVFANILVPPAFLRSAESDAGQQNQSQGGFDGFIARLENSLSNTKDVNRPTFTSQDYVGGLVIVLDTESIDDVWIGMKQLAAFFDFMQLFGLNLAPPPPSNLNGFSGFFSDPDDPDNEEANKFGIQLEWNKNYTTPAFNVYRSRVPGGQTVIEEYLPSSLVDNRETGEAGLLRIAWTWFANIFRKTDEPIVRPEREVQLYADPDFNGGEPVLVPATTGSSMFYVDQFIKTEEEVIEGQTYEIPYYLDSAGNKKLVVNYYYIIRSCTSTGLIEGPNSKELVVAIKTCNDNFNVADLIPHPSGQVEFFSVGVGKVNSWSSIKLSRMIPWFTEIVTMLNKFLDTLSGMVTDASDSFGDFLDQIASKISMYTQILSVVSWIIAQFKNFLLGSSIAFLSLDPAKGGNRTFVDRVRGAQPPEGESFTGPNGTTISIVLMYGGSPLDMAALRALQGAFSFIASLFTKD